MPVEPVAAGRPHRLHQRLPRRPGQPSARPRRHARLRRARAARAARVPAPARARAARRGTGGHPRRWASTPTRCSSRSASTPKRAPRWRRRARSLPDARNRCVAGQPAGTRSGVNHESIAVASTFSRGLAKPARLVKLSIRSGSTSVVASRMSDGRGPIRCGDLEERRGIDPQARDRVAAEQLRQLVGGHAAERGPEPFGGVGPRALRVRVVGGEDELVDPDLVAHRHLRGPRRARRDPAVAGEVLARLQRQAERALGDARVEVRQRRREPVGAQLDQHHLEPGEPFEHATEDELRERPARRVQRRRAEAGHRVFRHTAAQLEQLVRGEGGEVDVRELGVAARRASP